MSLSRKYPTQLIVPPITKCCPAEDVRIPIQTHYDALPMVQMIGVSKIKGILLVVDIRSKKSFDQLTSWWDDWVRRVVLDFDVSTLIEFIGKSRRLPCCVPCVQPGPYRRPQAESGPGAQLILRH